MFGLDKRGTLVISSLLFNRFCRFRASLGEVISFHRLGVGNQSMIDVIYLFDNEKSSTSVYVELITSSDQKEVLLENY